MEHTVIVLVKFYTISTDAFNFYGVLLRVSTEYSQRRSNRSAVIINETYDVWSVHSTTREKREDVPALPLFVAVAKAAGISSRAPCSHWRAARTYPLHHHSRNSILKDAKGAPRFLAIYESCYRDLAPVQCVFGGSPMRFCNQEKTTNWQVFRSWTPSGAHHLLDVVNSTQTTSLCWRMLAIYWSGMHRSYARMTLLGEVSTGKESG